MSDKLTTGESLYPFRAVGLDFNDWKEVTKALRFRASHNDSAAESPHTMSLDARRSYVVEAGGLRALAEKIEQQL